jgi:arsenite-transporting ATPase
VKGKKREPARIKSRSKVRKSPEQSDLPPTHFLFFGGKGGVGKTTSASAAALRLLDRASDGEQILLFSTDPAHSLSDSLGKKIGDNLTEVASHGKARLIAIEMDAGRVLDKFKAEHRATLHEIADRGTLLDENDINDLLDLSLPGMDEVMALFELTELDQTGKYDRIVVDTAPSGHTSRLLKLPEVFTRMLAALDLMSEKHRYMVAHFVRGSARADEVDLFLNDLTRRIELVRAMLYDKNNASFALVAIPEAMSVEETTRYYRLLQSEGVPVTDIVVNRVEIEHGDCNYCRARARGQEKYLQQLSKEFASLQMHRVPLMAGEVRGVDALREFAALVWDDGAELAPTPQVKKAATARSRDSRAAKSVDALIEPKRLLIFGGKGGVGKTTAAAATAISLAENDLDARVLIFSTDPAHSLSDCFEEEVGELRKKVAGVPNLDAMEIDPAAWFGELKERYRLWIDELFDTLAGGSRMEIKFDREAMRELVALAPPGIDEIAALSTMIDLLDQDAYTTIVLDTAPTGHLIRFLEMPEIALSWVRAFLKLLLKYKNVVRSGKVAEELIALSKSVKRVVALLVNADECEFIGVAIPEHMSLEETIRLTKTLARLKVPLSRLLINNLVPDEAARACEFCAGRRDAQRQVVKEFRKRLRLVKRFILADQQPHDIHGVSQLRKHFAGWQVV